MYGLFYFTDLLEQFEELMKEFDLWSCGYMNQRTQQDQDEMERAAEEMKKIE